MEWMELAGRRKRGRPWRSFMDVVKDMQRVGVTEEEAFSFGISISGDEEEPEMEMRKDISLMEDAIRQ